MKTAYAELIPIVAVVSAVGAIAMGWAPRVVPATRRWLRLSDARRGTWATVLAVVALSAAAIAWRPTAWRHIGFAPFVLGAALWVGAVLIMSAKQWDRKLAPPASAATLGWMRIVVCAALSFLAWSDDPLSVVAIPEEMVGWWSPGLLSPVLDSKVMRDPRFLFTIKWGTRVALLCALLGLGGRKAVWASVVFYMLQYHTIVQHTKFFHFGLLPLECLLLLAWLPCTDAFTITRAKPRHSPVEYGRAVFLVWLVYGLSYFVAGLSKLAVDPFWASYGNIQTMAVLDSLHFFEYDHNLAPLLTSLGVASGWFDAAGAGALVIELAGILVIVGPRYRVWVPALIFSLHLGMFFAHEFVFSDLVILPLMFVGVPRLQSLWKSASRALPRFATETATRPA